MIRGSFGSVVGERAFLGHDGVDAGCQDEISWKPLLSPHFRGFVSDDVAAGDVDAEGDGPFVIGNMAGGIGRKENAGGDDQGIEATVSERHLVEHGADAGAIGDVAREAHSRAAV